MTVLTASGPGARSERPSALRRLATTCYRRRWRILVLWLVALVGLMGVAASAAGEFEDTFELPGTESQRAFDALEGFGFGARGGATAQLVFRSDAGVDDPAVRAAIEGGLERIAAEVPEVEVASPWSPEGARQIAGDGRTAYAEINLAMRDQEEMFDAADVVKDVRESIVAQDIEGLQVELGGDPFLFGEPPEFGSEAIGFGAAIIILLVAFGSVLAMGLPLLTAAFGIACGAALVQLAANVLDMPSFTLQMVMMLGIGVGIDYALFIVTRYRQGLDAGLDPERSVVIAIDVAGRAVLFAGTTVIISVLGLFLVGLSMMRALATAAAIGVFVTMLASITLLPAVLGFVGRNIDRFGLPHRGRADGNRRGFWFRWSRIVQRRPWPAFALAFVVLVAMGAPVFAMRLGFSDTGNGQTTNTTRRAYDLLSDGFGPGFNGPLLVVVDLNGAGPDVAQGLAGALSETPGVASASPAIPNEDGTAAIVQVIPTSSPQDAATSELVHRLRDEVVPAATQGTPVEAHVGGFTAMVVDFADYTGSRLPWVIGAVLVLSFVVLMATFRSVLVPLKAVVMNLLSIGAAYGALVAVFQWGWGAGILGVGEPGPVEAWAPMMLFAIVFGLSMDYEVFLLSRMREEYDRTGDNAVAVADGLASTARVITAAAAIMVCVFAGFVLSPERALQLFGFGLAVAVFIDATIVRLVLVPATMELLGDRNWWLPPWLDRLLPDIHIEAPHDSHLDAPPLPEADDDADPELARV